MSLKISSIKRDLAAEDEGEWVDVAEWPGVRLRVRALTSKDYQNAREQRLRSLTKALGREPYSSEMAPFVGKLIATFILRGWEGIIGDDGREIEYTAAVALEMCNDPAMRELVGQIVLASNRVGDREVEFVAGAIKNSAAPSATS